MPYEPTEIKRYQNIRFPISNSKMHPAICDIKYYKNLQETFVDGGTKFQIWFDGNVSKNIPHTNILHSTELVSLANHIIFKNISYSLRYSNFIPLFKNITREYHI